MAFLYESAERPQEVRDLKWQDVNWNAQEVQFYSTKTNQDRNLPLREALKQVVEYVMAEVRHLVQNWNL